MTVQDGRLLCVEFVCDIWLGVIDDPPAHNEIRAFWNVKENRVLEYLPHGHRCGSAAPTPVTIPAPDERAPCSTCCFSSGLRRTTTPRRSREN